MRDFAGRLYFRWMVFGRLFFNGIPGLHCAPSGAVGWVITQHNLDGRRRLLLGYNPTYEY